MSAHGGEAGPTVLPEIPGGAGGAPAVLSAGLSCIDHIWLVEEFPPRASRTYADSYRSQGGGPAATAAVTVARLGGRSLLWAIHGDDPAGRQAIAELAGYGVDATGVSVLPGALSWVSGVLVAPDGERHIFPFRGSGLEDEPPADRLPAVGAVLVDGRHANLCRQAVRLAKEAGVPTVADVGNARYWQETEHVDVIIASQECGEEVLGRDEPEAALAAMRWREDQVVGVTLGAAGYLWDDGGGVRHQPALPVAVVDTTGAGDVFHGAYAFGLAAGWDHARCALLATATAALSCRAVGRSGIPTLAEVREFVTGRPAGVPVAG